MRADSIPKQLFKWYGLIVPTLLLFAPSAWASYGQMKLCRGAWECGLLSSLFFGMFIIPVVVIATVLIFGKINPHVPPPHKRGLGILIGIITYFVAVFAAALMSELVRAPLDFRFMAGVAWYLLFQFTLITATCKWLGTRISRGNSSDEN